MSQENVEIVRWAFEESHARRTVDLPGTEDRIAPGYRFHPRHGFPGRTVYRLDELPALWADLDATFFDHSLVPISYEAVGSNHVIATLRQTARLRGSDRQINDTLYQLWYLADGKAQETWTFTDKTDAFRAAGLSE